MKWNECTREDFKLMFDEAPIVVETDYDEILFTYWTNAQAKMGMRVTYRFRSGEILKVYYYIDFSQVYEETLKKYTTFEFVDINSPLIINQININGGRFATQIEKPDPVPIE